MSELSRATADELLSQTRWVKSLARALVFDAHDAEDVVQETFLSALERPPRGVGNFRSWLGGVVRHVAREARRSERRRKHREQISSQITAYGSSRGDGLSTMNLVERAELMQRIVRAVLELDEPYRMTLLLHYFEEISTDGIARKLGIPSSTVRNRLRRGLDHLRSRFHREGGSKVSGLALLSLISPRESTWLIGSARIGVSLMSVKTLTVASTAFFLIAIGAAVLTYPASHPLQLGSAAFVQGPLSQEETLLEEDRQRIELKRDPTILVRGRVIDMQGHPVQGARLFVGSFRTPSKETTNLYRIEERKLVQGPGMEELLSLSKERLQELNVAAGRVFETDASGDFTFPLEPDKKVLLAPLSSLGVRVETDQARWLTPPSSDIVFTVRRVDLATIALSAVDKASGNPVPEIRGSIQRDASLERETFRVFAGSPLRKNLEVEGKSTRYHVTLEEPLWARTTRSVEVAAGSSEDILLVVDSGAGTKGLVVDEDGLPIEKALVYWGPRWKLNDGFLFRASDPSRIFDGVRTDERGQFTLPGIARDITVWHEGYCPTTVSSSQAEAIQLVKRGSIRGFHADDAGIPLPGVELTLDQTFKTVTDDMGRYAFEALEDGVHTLWFGNNKSLLGVRVLPAQCTEVAETAPLDEVLLQSLSQGQPYLESLGALSWVSRRRLRFMNLGTATERSGSEGCVRDVTCFWGAVSNPLSSIFVARWA